MKPGYLTTEFWLTVLTNVVAIVVVLRPATKIDPSMVRAAATVAAAVANGFYSYSRGKVKSNAGH